MRVNSAEDTSSKPYAILPLSNEKILYSVLVVEHSISMQRKRSWVADENVPSNALRVYQMHKCKWKDKQDRVLWETRQMKCNVLIVPPLLFISHWELTVRKARSKWLHLSMPLKKFLRSSFQHDSVISLKSIYIIKVPPLKASLEWESQCTDLLQEICL